MVKNKVLAALEEIATNKAVAVIDIPVPGDIVDLYITMKKGGISYKRVLQSLSKRVGCYVDATTFFSQILIACRKMQQVPYLLYIDDEEKQKRFIGQIENYFGKLSAEFLHQRLKAEFSER